MSFNKKLNKLQRDPIRFFSDMKVLNKVLLKRKILVEEKSLNKTSKQLRQKKEITENKNDFLYYRSIKNRVEIKEKYFWDWYKEHNSQRVASLTVKKENTVLALPSGDTLWDIHLAHNLEKNGYIVYFFEIWNHFSEKTQLHIDDILYLTSKDPMKTIDLSDSILSFIEMYSINVFIVSEDINVLTRFCVKQCQRNSIWTVMVPYNQDELGKKYSHSKRHNVVDEIVCLYNIPAFLDEINLNKRVSLLSHFKDSEKSVSQFRKKYAIEDNDEIITIFLPAVSVQSNTYQDELVSFLAKYCNEYTYHKHIFIISPNKVTKNIQGVLDRQLIKFPKKSVIFRHRDIDLELMTEISTHIFVHQGVEKSWIEKLSEDEKTSIFSGFEKPKRTDIQIIEKFKGAQEAFDLIVVPDEVKETKIAEGRQKYLNTLLNTRRRNYAVTKNLLELMDADYFLQWGAEPNENKSRAELYRTLLKKDKLFVEDGFIRSLGLWTNEEEPTLSVVMDTKGIYYDATKETLLEELLNSNLSLSSDDLARVEALINKIVTLQISKYNYAPKIDLPFAENRKRVLLVDQKAGDMSLKYGLADSTTFEKMLDYALAMGDDTDIIIKQHPCAITGDEDQAHYTKKKLGKIAEKENVHLISFDINPYSLINAVDEVLVVSSGMGFEALMANKPVTCFGAPFYSNWGLTKDMCNIDRRMKKRTLEELFYVFYILLSSYVSPKTGKRCELETLIDYMGQHTSK